MKKFLLLTAILLNGVLLRAQGIYNLWGMTPAGGANDMGVIFKTDAIANKINVVYNFNKVNIGGGPVHTQLVEYNGKFYGVTSNGGKNNKGVIFEWDPVTNIYTKKFDFDEMSGQHPWGSLALKDGKLYGMTSQGGANYSGVIFEWNPTTNIYTKKIDFNFIDGGLPFGSLTMSLGKFYGMTYLGGVNDVGVIFEWDPVTNLYIKKIDFNVANGCNPQGNLTQKGGKFYGMTTSGGINTGGVIFEWDPAANVYIKKFDFNNPNGSQPNGSLTFNGGKFYGMATIGGSTNGGVIFEWDPASNLYTKKIDFNSTNGLYPVGNLAFANGKFYGMTPSGSNGNGLIFEWDPITNTYTKKFDFEVVNNQGGPQGSLTLLNGKFYGMTSTSSIASGVIFEWDPLSNLYSKKIDLNLSDGSNPQGSLVYNSRKLYGMTFSGGEQDAGVIFELSPSENVYTKKANLLPINVGLNPTGSLTPVRDKFYGMTTGAVGGNDGRLFEWLPNTNVLSLKYNFSFSDGFTDGSLPHGDITEKGGRLYGITSRGGSNNAGVIFEFDTSTNTYSQKIDFNGTDGSYPNGNLTLLHNKFYGTTTAGGTNNVGVIFEWDPSTNIYTKKIDFNGFNGNYPAGNLTFNNGKFYGMTKNGGNSDMGVIFEWDPVTNIYTKKFDFNGTNGSLPYGSLTLSSGKFYGMTNSGGTKGFGVIFEWNPATNIYAIKQHFDGTNGSSPIYNRLTLAPAPLANGNAGVCINFPYVAIDATNNNQWVSITDDENNAVAEIKANGNNLGIVNASMFINGGTVRKDKNNKFYLDRNITISPQVQPKTPVDVRLYIKATEYEALKNAANVKGKPNAIDSITDVKIYPANSKCSPTVSALGNAVGTVAEKWENDFVLTASVCSLSSFFFAPKTTCAPPVISNMLISTDTLWPPLHSLRGISVAYKTSGDCKCDPVTRWLTVKSNEPISGTGSADKSPDWIIKDANHVYLRAERSDRGTGRIYTITINAQNTAGAVSTYDFTVAVPLTMPAAKAAAMASKQLQEEVVLPPLFNCSISPNPTDGYFNLQVETASAEKIEVRVIDMSGALIKSSTASNHQPLRFGNDLKPGVYMIKVLQGQQQQIIKVIKQ